MKCLLFLLILLISQACFAYEFKWNPDRRASVEFNFNHLESNGDYVVDGLRFYDKDAEISNGVTLDLRLPVSDFLTLHLGGVYSARKFGTYDYLDVKHWYSTSSGMTMGLKVYFP